MKRLLLEVDFMERKECWKMEGVMTHLSFEHVNGRSVGSFGPIRRCEYNYG